MQLHPVLQTTPADNVGDWCRVLPHPSHPPYPTHPSHPPYPLTDDEWAKGKCGFKAIQFMACGVPVVAAAVGVNRDIIRDGENGFTAAAPREWVAKLEQLLSDPALRAMLGRAGRHTVEERYSLDAHAPRFVSAIRDAVDRAQRRGSMTASRPRRHDELAVDDFTDDGDVSRPIQQPERS